MSTSRIFHSFHLDISTCEANRICYIILPERLKESEKPWLDRMVETLSANMVVISGLEWDTDLTPWKAPGLKTGEFAGKAQAFLDILSNDLIVNVESSLRLNRPERHICGVSLSGLFAIWASCKKDIFTGAASVSGSFWYDGFAEWILKQEELKCVRYYVSMGDKEKETKVKRFANIEEDTIKVVETLMLKGAEVAFEVTEGGHNSPVVPRIEKSVVLLLGNR